MKLLKRLSQSLKDKAQAKANIDRIREEYFRDLRVELENRKSA